MHKNVEHCEGCEKVLNKYPGFHPPLREWLRLLRTAYLDAHVSWAGRGREDQELFFRKGLSKAHFGQSSHNYNAALDFFQLTPTGAYFGTEWYKRVLGARVVPEVRWYGVIEGKGDFLEYGHVEWREWKKALQAGELKPVEPL